MSGVCCTQCLQRYKPVQRIPHARGECLLALGFELQPIDLCSHSLYTYPIITILNYWKYTVSGYHFILVVD